VSVDRPLLALYYIGGSRLFSSSTSISLLATRLSRTFAIVFLRVIGR